MVTEVSNVVSQNTSAAPETTSWRLAAYNWDHPAPGHCSFMDSVKFSSKCRFRRDRIAGSIHLQLHLQTIFADDSYSKPYFVTYVNSSFFSLLLLLVAAKRLWATGGSIKGALRGHDRSTHYLPIVEEEEQAFIKPDDDGGIQEASRSPRSRLLIEEPSKSSGVEGSPSERRLNVRETLKLSFEFCILWVGIISIETKHG